MKALEICDLTHQLSYALLPCLSLIDIVLEHDHFGCHDEVLLERLLVQFEELIEPHPLRAPLLDYLGELSAPGLLGLDVVGDFDPQPLEHTCLLVQLIYSQSLLECPSHPFDGLLSFLCLASPQIDDRFRDELVEFLG